MKKMTYIIVLLLTFNFGYGQSIFDNPITGTNPNNDNPYTVGQTVDANITVSGIGRGAGATGRNATNEYSASSWDSPSIDLAAYFEFTITPNSGFEIDFASFIYNSTTSATGPINFALRSSLDGYTTDIGSPIIGMTTIDLSSVAYQNITSAITFRIYSWAASSNPGRFRISDFTFNGTVSPPLCPTTTTWDGTNWDNGDPDLSKVAVLNASYNTTTSSIGSFSACSLIINSSGTIPEYRLTVTNNAYIEVQNDVTINGQLYVETQGNFVQNNDAALFTDNSTNGVRVRKEKIMQNWYSYTYWSSPVLGESIESVLGVTPTDRRFRFEAANFVDVLIEIGNSGNFIGGSDDIDDDGNDWVPYVTGIMDGGVGYATTASEFAGPGGYPNPESFDFFGALNNGVITTSIIDNSLGAYYDWNLIGNPYPGAISADQFFTVNAGLVDVIYLWDQATPPNANAGGSQNNNFSNDDYAIINAGTGETGARGDTGTRPLRFIPSGQGFFVEALTTGVITFNNSMRSSGADNSQFFKGSNQKNKSKNKANKLWVNMFSDNGASNQILIGYVNGATSNNDGSYYDTKRVTSSENTAMLYSVIENDNNKFAIQGKAPSDLNENEIINLGFKTAINVATLYTISIDELQGDFLNTNTVYLKDNLLNVTHDLSTSDYTFTSEVGEFNNRFQIGFSTQVLSNEVFDLDKNTLSILELEHDNIQFSVSKNTTIKSVLVFDMLGRQLYNLKGENSTETYTLSNLKSTVYIAKVKLSNGAIITKKAVKK